jgi:ATP-binding cassette, subfamily C (CFTR/MRP), member 1
MSDKETDPIELADLKPGDGALKSEDNDRKLYVPAKADPVVLKHDGTSKKNSDSILSEGNFFTKWTYTWMNEIFMIGGKRPLEMTDIWRLNYSSKDTGEQLKALWAAEKAEAAQQNRKPDFAIAIRKMMFWGMIWAGFLKFMDLSYVFSPLLIGYLVNFVSASRTANPLTLGVGIGYAFGILGFALLGTLLNNRYFQIANVQVVRAKSALTYMIYEKSMRLSAAARQNFTAGKVTTLISSDLNRMEQFLLMCNQIWMSPIQIIVIIALLIYSIGYINF